MRPLSISFFSIYLLCGISDILDGYIARKTKSISKLGGKLDSIGDFIVIFSTIIVLYPIIDLEEVFIFILIIFIIKLISIIIGFYKFKELVMPHTYANKFTGFILFLYPMFFRIIELNYILCSIALISALEEVLINLKSKKVEVNIKSLFHLKL